MPTGTDQLRFAARRSRRVVRADGAELGDKEVPTILGIRARKPAG